MRLRKYALDNLGTTSAPTYRRRIQTPLTPRAVRRAMLIAPAWLDADQSSEWLKARQSELKHLLTPLDLMLGESEALALEQYCDAEEMLAGSTRTHNWDPPVQASGGQGAPLPDEALEALAAHVVAKKALPRPTRDVLAIFVAQQLGAEGAPSAAEAGLMRGLPGRNRRRAWWHAVAVAAARLVRMGY